MKKISEVSYTTQSGHNVVVRVTRLHGPEEKEVWIDQEETITEFVDRSIVEISIDGGKYHKCRYENYKGYDTLGYGDNSTRHYYRVAIPADKLAKVRELQEERLTDELSADEAEDIRIVRESAMAGKVLAKSELIAKRKEYRDGMLEGGYGYNPYEAEYISEEFLQMMKKKYPKELGDL